MLVPEYIECSFRELLLTKPYEKITVSEICDSAQVARTLFYTYYSDKDDLLGKIIFKDVIQPTIKLQESLPALKVKSASQLIVEQMFLNILEKRELYQRINAIDNHASLVNTITDHCTIICFRILENAEIASAEKEYLAFTTSAAQAMLISKWIERGYDLDPDRMAKLSRKWILDCWRDYFDLNY